MGANAVRTQARGWTRVGQAPQSAPRKRSVTFQGQVLIVENLRERSQPVRDMLAQERFEVGVVEDARDAVELLSQGFAAGQGTVPELIICNVRMLGEAGLEALAQLSASHPEVSILLISAFTSPKQRARLERIPGAYILDQFFALEDVRSAALELAASRRSSL
ncbi:response regulator [Archangium sp.]|uniref:response regulator n=1 Tax=Archangium sp. TaxID=1872627 RepID=UPI002ED9D1F7